ncbi:Hypothetical predicted protein [Cloeon dipterum]|uniref:Uncharacterized protein n=1 Tax=Cloeon dipterum TaxID=197152 RepID=A0A8S1DL53_9INSE|nr:Hypothetical predicted protein [Cloeon dipterum]
MVDGGWRRRTTADGYGWITRIWGEYNPPQCARLCIRNQPFKCLSACGGSLALELLPLFSLGEKLLTWQVDPAVLVQVETARVDSWPARLGAVVRRQQRARLIVRAVLFCNGRCTSFEGVVVSKRPRTGEYFGVSDLIC